MVRRNVREAGVGEALVAALLVSAFYLPPLVGGGPWIVALLATCAAGAVALALDPRRIRVIPPLLIGFVAVYALAGLIQGVGGASDIGRFIVRPVAIVALALFLTTAAARRRALVLVLVAIVPQAVVTGAQALDTLIEFGRAAAQQGADGVTGTLGDSEANTVGLVAVGGMVVAAGLALAGVLRRGIAGAVAAAMVATCVFSSTRAAVVLIPVAAVALAAIAYLALRGRAPRRALIVCVAVGLLSAPVVYAGTEAIYPGAFTGAFSNQNEFILGDGRPIPDKPGGDPREDAPEYVGPRGVAVLPGRVEQLRLAVELSFDDGIATTLFGRGYGSASVYEDAVIGSDVPRPHRTGVTWGGKILTETGWLGVIAFAALVGWIAWLGVTLMRRATDPWDGALGYAAPGLAALTAGGAFYTTVLDVRAYSALFIVLIAALVAATRSPSSAAGPGASGSGRRARASTPLPPRHADTSAAPSATSARST